MYVSVYIHMYVHADIVPALSCPSLAWWSIPLFSLLLLIQTPHTLTALMSLVTFQVITALIV